MTAKRWIEPAILKCIIENTPLVSIDVIVRRKKDKKVLLGLRKNRPAQGYWFVPGGRIFKDEKISEAFERITENELGVRLNIEDAHFLGVYEHFYEDSYFDTFVGTHYIVNAYEITINNIDVSPDDQHTEFRWFSEEEILSDNSVHQYCKAYFRK
ncbi:MAG: DUF4916 domain-containing protein [Aquificota bacterium]|nr:MAG: DUF4916 domain-containing protein [Aquificota bacterium]